jgi:hypothetical protein
MIATWWVVWCGVSHSFYEKAAFKRRMSSLSPVWMGELFESDSKEPEMSPEGGRRGEEVRR